MLTWVTHDDSTTESLVRSGRGIINSPVLAVPRPGTGSAAVVFGSYRVEIRIAGRSGRPGRHSVAPVLAVLGEDDLVALTHGFQHGCLVDWAIRWDRLPHVDPTLPVAVLNFAEQTVATLVWVRFDCPQGQHVYDPEGIDWASAG